jgi:hypothetical protein
MHCGRILKILAAQLEPENFNGALRLKAENFNGVLQLNSGKFSSLLFERT